MDQSAVGDHPQENRKPPVWVRGAVWMMLLLIAGLGLYQLRDNWYPIYEYRTGTPTTATIDYCEELSAPHSMVVCTGTWTDEGQSQSGIIDGANQMLAPGSPLVVHVKDGAAYTARSEHMSIVFLVFFSLVLIGLCALMIRGIRRMQAGR